MTRIQGWFAVTAFLLPLWLRAQDRPQDANRLPIKRVVLYKNGVGYFEHIGRVHGNQDVTIPFTSGQLNDVLKSLTVLDLNGGHISSVAYGSAAPVDRQIGDLRLPLGEKSSLTDFLGALRGARLEIKNGASAMTGRLLSIERKTRIAGATTLDVDYLSLISDSGEIKTMEVAPGFSVRLLDPGLAGRVGRFLDIVSLGREADVRRMVISTEGAGDRSVFVSYISEVPVWKSTYRIVLSSKAGESPLLQGWAIVDNTVGQDWNNVQLSLVAGAPQSFVQNLSMPYYTRRPVVPMPEAMAVSPQTYESTLLPGNGVFASAGGSIEQSAEFQAGAASQTVTVQAAPLVISESMGASEVNRTIGTGRTLGSGVALGGVRGGVGAGRGGGVGSGQGGGVGGGVFRVAAAQELGDLFEYKLKDPITIQKNRSALLPIVQSSITAEKVSIWNDRAGLPRPQRALWLANSTGLTLDGGSFSVMEEDTFAGEGIFEPIRPAEKRLVSYALDLAVNASSRNSAEQQGVTRVRASQGVMTQESEIREKKTYTFRNEDTSPRTVIVEHPVRTGYELRSQTKPAETTADWMRFRVPVAPKETAVLVVEEARPIKSIYTLTNVTGQQVDLFVRQRSINATVEDALRRILVQKGVASALESEKNARDEEMSKIFDDQQRLRENMKALKGSAEEKLLLQRYTQQLNEQENRLEKLRKEKEGLESQHAKARDALNKMIQDLSFDVKL